MALRGALDSLSAGTPHVHGRPSTPKLSLTFTGTPWKTPHGSFSRRRFVGLFAPPSALPRAVDETQALRRGCKASMRPSACFVSSSEEIALERICGRGLPEPNRNRDRKVYSSRSLLSQSVQPLVNGHKASLSCYLVTRRTSIAGPWLADYVEG